jgi:hypothetical protein
MKQCTGSHLKGDFLPAPEGVNLRHLEGVQILMP